MNAPVIEGATIEIDDFGGMCPVQGYGSITPTNAEVFNIFATKAWYFRARGQHWSVTVGTASDGYVPAEGADLVVSGSSDDIRPYSAGYMDDDESERHLAFALTIYAAGIRGRVRIPDPAGMHPPCMKCGEPAEHRVSSLPVCNSHRNEMEAAFAARAGGAP